MSIKGMSIESIAEVLKVRSPTVSNWFFRTAKQCEKVNEDFMNDFNVSRFEMDELWIIVGKKLLLEKKLGMKGPIYRISFLRFLNISKLARFNQLLFFKTKKLNWNKEVTHAEFTFGNRSVKQFLKNRVRVRTL